MDIILNITGLFHLAACRYSFTKCRHARPPLHVYVQYIHYEWADLGYSHSIILLSELLIDR